MDKDLRKNKNFGEIYITTTKPGMTRGCHYHLHTTEWFFVVKGKGKLILKNRKTGDESEIVMGGKHKIVVEVSPGIIHEIKNIAKGEMILIAYADNAYDYASPDTFKVET